MNPEVSIQELQQLMKEIAISQKETEQLFRETDKKFQETDKKFLETEKKLNRTISLFESQWGKFIESLVEGNLISLLRSKGIDVHETSQRRKGTYNGKQFEFDIIAHNGNEIVIVEVKSTLNVSAVKEFLDELPNAKSWMHEYKNFKIYGAVAYLRADEDSVLFAERQGLFAIRATGDSAVIVNNENFVPKEW
jgi:Holliday junction resolvase-like predicted endonuclease